MATETAWIAAWLQCNDAFYPTGSYAHSFGLEGLIAEGVVTNLASFRAFLAAAALPALARVDLPLCAHAHAALSPRAEDWDRFLLVCATASAMKAAREPREASEGIGRQRLALLAALRPHPLVHEAQRRLGLGTDEEGPLPACAAAALEARVLGAPAEAALASVLYGTVAALSGAAIKLLRLGQNGIQQALTGALDDAPALISRALAAPFGEIGWSNPWWDVAAARHELARERLFIS